MNTQAFEKLDLRPINLETEQGEYDGLFTDYRFNPETLPEGLIAYGIRSDDDDDSIPRTVEPSVCVNSFGTLIINEPLDFGSADHIRITEWGFLDNDDAPQWAQPYLD